MYGIGSFACQLLVSDAAVCNMRHGHLKTVAISDEMLFRRAIVGTEHLFVHVTEQMERLYCNVRAFQSALEQAPKVFESVSVNLPGNIAFRMVNRLVNEVLVIQSLIGHERIGIDRARVSVIAAWTN
jgi:hypothetical protein